MGTKKKEDKKISYNDYFEKIGDDLVAEAERIGNPAAFVQAKYGLSDKLFCAWLGNSDNGRYKSEHFCACHEKFKQLRKDFLDKIAINGKINRDLYACLNWSQLYNKVNPPKEVTCEADVKTTMKVEDLNNIIAKLEDKKNSSGF